MTIAVTVCNDVCNNCHKVNNDNNIRMSCERGFVGKEKKG